MCKIESVTLAVAKNVENNLSGQGSVRIVGSDALARVRAWLIDNDYAESVDRVSAKGTPDDAAAARSASELPAVRLLSSGSPLTMAEATTIFAHEDLQIWIDSGLLAKEEDRVEPLVKITPHRNLFVVSDRDWADEAASRPDVVMGLASSSTWLADFTIRRDSDCTLDLGTGTGVQAMLASRHSKQVVATDINPRALEFARFNAALNGIDNIEFVEGDMFDAVEGRTFDLIVCNPPFSISPASTCLYRDNPGDGDGFVKRIIQTAPEFLSNDGYAQILCNWVQSSGESWTDRISDWLKPTGCNAWIVRGKTFSPADYARQWLKGYDASNVEKLFGDWMSYYEQQGITSIDGGLITMRQSDRQPNWLRIDANLPRIFPDAGAHVARCFWLQDVLDRMPGHELLNEILYLSPSVELTQISKPSITGWQLQSCQLTMTRGIAYTVRLDPMIARVVAACNGRQQLGRLLQAVAIADGEDLNVIVTRYLGALRRLVTLGFLWPARHGFEKDFVAADSKPTREMLEEERLATDVVVADMNVQGCDEKEALSA